MVVGLLSTRDPGIQVGHYSQRTAALKQIGRTYVRSTMHRGQIPYS